jgi:hypothetical protein
MKTVFKLAASAAVCAGLMLVAPLAEASETGLDIIHVLRREHGHLCMADHIHYGNGGGGTKSIAQAEAVKSWAILVVVEYGTSWGHYSRAGNRAANCKKSAEAWECEVQGRPCK